MRLMSVAAPFRNRTLCEECRKSAVVWLSIGTNEKPLCGLCIANLRDLLTDGDISLPKKEIKV